MHMSDETDEDDTAAARTDSVTSESPPTRLRTLRLWLIRNLGSGSSDTAAPGSSGTIGETVQRPKIHYRPW